MRKILLSLMIAAPLAVAAADSPPRIQTKQIDATIEDLAHLFFYHSSRLEERLASIVSQQGARAVSPAAIEHKKMMNDRDVLLGKARQLCAELKNARTGEEFAEIFTRYDERERAEKRQHAAQVLARLDQYDRKALEDYLNTEYREAGTSSVIDYHAVFATGPFPSDYTRKIMRSVCEEVPPAQGDQQ